MNSLSKKELALALANSAVEAQLWTLRASLHKKEPLDLTALLQAVNKRETALQLNDEYNCFQCGISFIPTESNCLVMEALNLQGLAQLETGMPTIRLAICKTCFEGKASNL